jgi:hypothetical protein
MSDIDSDTMGAIEYLLGIKRKRDEAVGALAVARAQTDEARSVANELLYLIYHRLGDEQRDELAKRDLRERYPWLAEWGHDPRGEDE